MRSWLCQSCYGDPRLHYEVWSLGERRALGMDWEAEQWDKGWAMVYTVLEPIFEEIVLS